MKFQLSTSRLARQRNQRRGSVLVYFALGLTAFIGTAALVVDMGSLYNRKSNAQLAADASALAGAYKLANFDSNNATSAALEMARKNGYDSNQAGVQVIVTNPVPGQPKRISTKVSRIEPLFFARIFGLSQ